MNDRSNFLWAHLSGCYVAAVLLLVGCASTSTKSDSLPSPKENSRQPSESPDVRTYFYDSDGIKYSSTKTKEDTLLIPLEKSLVQKEISPEGGKIAVSYEKRDSTKISVIDLENNKSKNIHSFSSNKYEPLSISLEWSPDSEKLAIGYYSEKKSGEVYVADEGNVVVAMLSGEVRDLGCSVSKEVKTWLPNGNIVVSEGAGRGNMYTVDANNCSTINTFKVKDKEEISFSPDGSHFIYFESAKLQDRNTEKTKIPELYIADSNGENKNIIAGYKYEPRNATWSPEGNKIAFDVQSQEWSNIRHVAIYDLAADEASFYKEQDMLGLPSSEEPHWSPDGRKLFYHNTYERGEGGTVTHRINRNVVRNVATNETMELTKEIVPRGEKGSVGTPMKWIGNRTVLIGSTTRYRIVDISTKAVRELPSDRSFLYFNRIN